MNIIKRIDRIRYKLVYADIGDMLFKLLLSWVLISAFYVASSDISFVNTFFFKKIKLSVFIVSTLSLWIILCKIKEKSFIRILMILAVLVYSILGVIGYTDFSFSVGCCIALGIVVFLTDLSDIRLKIHWSVPWVMAGMLTVGFTFFVGYICCLYYNNHWTSCFDFGIFSQMFYHMKESGLPLVTCERDRLLSHFAVHFSPIYYLLLPIYMLIPDPRTLLVMQALIVASGVIPLLLICSVNSPVNTINVICSLPVTIT